MEPTILIFLRIYECGASGGSDRGVEGNGSHSPHLLKQVHVISDWGNREGYRLGKQCTQLGRAVCQCRLHHGDVSGTKCLEGLLHSYPIHGHWCVHVRSVVRALYVLCHCHQIP